jgi:hypothetical protein
MGQAADSVVRVGEYDHSIELQAGVFRLHWRIETSTVAFAIQARTTGWVALGIGPGEIMDQADMIFCWVDSNGSAGAIDAFSTGLTGPHPPDTELGGADHILDYSVRESGGWTTAEFTRRLETGDPFDKPVPEQGPFDIVWAYSDHDDFVVPHIKAGRATLDPQKGGNGIATLIPPRVFLRVHAGVMILGFLLMAGAILPARRLPGVHAWLEAIAATLTLGGLAVGILVVITGTGHHLASLHARVASVTVGLIVFTVVGGQIAIPTPSETERGRRRRTVHRWLGRITLSLVLATILLGLLTPS